MNYNIPHIALMKEVPLKSTIHDFDELKAQGELLTSHLKAFKIKAEVVNIEAGPVITRYELQLSAGTKSKNILDLEIDLAMALKAKAIRISPITEKSVIAVEIPNDNPEIIHIKPLLDSPEFKDNSGINIVLGRNVSGNPVITDLTKAPHMLVAGQTGAGKSIGVNSILLSILTSKTPDEVKLVLIDPKVVELSPYADIPHLLTPIITEPKKAVEILEWLTKDMDERYKLLANQGVRNIADYSGNDMPYIVVVIDELADLMMTAGKEVEAHIVRIAQKARAVGIHLILTTQRPSVDVITGTIKANVPTRIGFRTASQIDARTIMDKAGCEQLLGRGDMLFKNASSPDVVRIHGSFVDYEDADVIIKATTGQVKQDFIKLKKEIPISINGIPSVSDDLTLKAQLVIQETGIASISMLQRKLGINYELAENVIAKLKKQGDIE